MPQLLSLFRRKPTPNPPPDKPPTRAVVIEWRGEDDEFVRQAAEMRAENGVLAAFVSRQPPEGRLARVIENASSYPVEVISVTACESGYEIRMDYLWEGRRRQHRTAIEGSAQLVANGCAPIPVEVVNVSASGMKLFATQPVEEGSPARLIGANDDYMCFVRYCSPAQQGYHIGIQFYGDGRYG